MGEKKQAKEARDRKARELHRKGFSLNEIAAKLGVSRMTVVRALGRVRYPR